MKSAAVGSVFLPLRPVAPLLSVASLSRVEGVAVCAQFSGRRALVHVGDLWWWGNRLKVVRIVDEYAPHPAAGPGCWQLVYRDEVIDAATNAVCAGVTPNMLLVLTAAHFSRGALKRRLVE